MSETAGSKLSASVLGQLLLMQSVLDSLPDETSIRDFVCRGLSDLPGVRAVAWDTEFASNVEEATERIPLMVGNTRKGELIMRLADRAAFRPYKDYLKNFCFMVAVILEEREQRRALLKHKAELEERVEERTAELVRQMTERQRMLEEAVRVRRTLQDTVENQRRAEASLRESEERLKLVLEGSQLGFWDWNIETGQVRRNERWAEMLGYTLDEIELSVKQWTDLHHPDDRAAAWKSIEDHLEGLTPIHEIEYRMLGKDGQYRWILDRAKVVGWDAQGKPARMSGTHSDITVRKMAEAALLHKTEELDHFFKITPDLLCIADTNGYFLRLNTAWERKLGYSPDELMARPFLDFVHPDDVEPTLAAVAALTSQKEVIDFVNRYRCKDGAYRWLEWRSVPAGKIIYAAARDITERRLAETEHVRLATAIEQAPDAVVITDPNWIIRYANPAFERMTGYGQAESIGLHTRILKSGQHDRAFYRKIRETLAGGDVWQGRLVNKRKDGAFYDAESTASPIRDASGAIINYVMIHRDITNELRLEKALRQSLKMESIGTLAGGIAHDFNNILGAIIGYTEMAQADAAKGGQLWQNLAQVLKAGFRARDLVKQILTFSRRTEEERKPVEFAPIVKEAMKLLRASLPSTIEINRNITEDAHQVMVLADPTQIHQVLMNLCTNAAHAMRARGGVLSVGLRNMVTDDILSQNPDLREGLYVCLEVSDTGHGMDAGTMERIFDPYFTTKEVGEGTGLGLSVVQGIVKSHGGAIIAHSEPGNGTTFSVFFPRIEKEAASKAGEEETIPRGSERILFVDDELALIDLGKKMLESLGYKVTNSKSSLEALEIFRSDPGAFDLVITDMTMPGLTGRDLAERLLAIRKDLPIILCTGFNQMISGKPLEELGVRELILKPCTMATLAKAIRKTLEQK